MFKPKVRMTVLGGPADRNNPTGSCLLLEIRIGKFETRGLIDVGMWQGKDASKRNALLPPHPERLDFIVLTHPHTDHAGRLPFAVKNGFCGRVFCTKPTAALLPPMLLDSAKIVQMEARNRKRKASRAIPTKRKQRKKRARQFKPPEFVFSDKDVEQSLALIKCEGYDYYDWIHLGKRLYLKFYPSGHVLGGGICVLRIDRNSSPENSIYIGFSGDLGREDGIILPSPVKVKEKLDWWMTESTYGGMKHPPRDKEISKLIGLLYRAQENGGKILIPSFSLERTQELMYILSCYMREGKAPPLTIYLDSPLAEKITRVFAAHWDDALLFKGQEELDFNPFDRQENPYLKVVEDMHASIRLMETSGSCIIIAGAGMCDAGRIRDHLKKALPDKKNTICLVGHMVEGTLGRKLSEMQNPVHMNGYEISVRADIVQFQSFSAHGDKGVLVGYPKRIVIKKGVFILHGDRERSHQLQQDLRKKLSRDVTVYIPALNEAISLT